MISSLSFKPPLVLQLSGAGPQKFPLDLKVFTTGTDKHELYALRYRAFLDAGLISARTDKLFKDDYDELATTVTIAAFDRKVCVGTFRLTFGSGMQDPATMPCQSIFPEVAALKAGGYSRVVEFTRMVVDPDLTNMSFRTTLYATLVRAGLIVAHAGDADFGLISINPSHVRFYEMMCGFQEMARAENYPGINAPVVLLGRDFAALERRRVRQNPFFKLSTAEIERARRTLFADQSGRLAESAVA